MKLLNEPNGNKIEYSEIVYCYNCDSEAVFCVDWTNKSGMLRRTFMCQSCKDAFEFGQETKEPAHYVENLID